MKDAYYFSHDSNARNDPKILKLRRMLGMEGLGVFWCILEMLREADGHRLKYDLELIDDIAFDLRVGSGDIMRVIQDFELFEIVDGFFHSASLTRRMERMEEIREKRRKAGQKGGKSKASAKQMLSKPEANAKQVSSNEKKGKEIKGNETETAPEKIFELIPESTQRYERIATSASRAGYAPGEFLLKLMNVAIANGKADQMTDRQLCSYIESISTGQYPKPKAAEQPKPDTGKNYDLMNI